MIIIDDNFLSSEEISYMEKEIFTYPPRAFWAFRGQTNSPDSDSGHPVLSEDIAKSFQMLGPISLRITDKHHLQPSILNILSKFLDKHKIECTKILRIVLNVIPRDIANYTGQHHPPHVDTNVPHKAFLYYVNDSDGDTYFFNELWSGSEVTEFTKSRSISPKKGQALVFDGFQYHASSSPIDSAYRCVINIDFV
jgi:hypothetical protein